MVFVSPSSLILGWCLYWAMASLFQILSFILPYDAVQSRSVVLHPFWFHATWFKCETLCTPLVGDFNKIVKQKNKTQFQDIPETY
jgi:hypothetical protein